MPFTSLQVGKLILCWTVGCDHEDGFEPALFGPSNLSLSALELLCLENFTSVPDWHMDCPSLEALHLRNIEGLCLPTGLGSCSRLTILDVAEPIGPAPVAGEASLIAAIEAVRATLEVLDVSGWAAGILDTVRTLPRLHTLVAQRNGLSAVPALPVTLSSLDLRANEFTDVPVQLESLTQLTFLALSSKEYLSNFQIRRPLDALISLPHLRKLTLVLDPESSRPAYERWTARSLHYLGLARYEIARSNSSLLLEF